MPESGELVLLVSPKGKRYLRRVEPGQTLHTGDGVLEFDRLLQAEYGQSVATHLGAEYQILRPTIYELVKGLKRETQIIYPKDIGYICMKLGIGPGRRVIEAGSGSGSLTLALSWFSGPTGRVYSYEQREEFHRLCRRNLDWAGLGENVELFCQDISQGFSQSGVDALFLDVREPWHYLDQAAAAVRPGGMLGFLMPTHHQVCDLLRGMETRPFEEPDVLEILLRRHKPVADRFRPADRMVAHTGYLIFTRKLCETGRPAAAPPAEESDLEI